MKHMIFVAAVLLAAFPVSADRLVRLHGLTDCTVETLLQEGYDIASVSANDGYVDIMIDERDIHTLEGKASEIRLLPEDWAHLLPENTDNAGYYYSPEENWAFWCGHAAAHSDLVDTPVTIGQSFESRDIYMISMTSASGPPVKPSILFTALTHAREPGGNSAIIDFAVWLADEYGSDTMATFILDNAEIRFVPIVNPDGYLENMPGGGLHRKNMNFSVPVPSSGIDLNRNFGYMWGYDNIGSSPDPYSTTYRGSSAFSEPETQVMRDFHNGTDPIGIMNYHTYGGYLLHPWGYISTACPDYATFQAWGAQMTAQNGYEYGSCSYCLGYPANGDANDWAYGDTGHDFCMGMTPEVGYNGFWGGQSDSSIIAGDCADCRFMNKLFCMFLLQSVGIGDDADLEIAGSLSITGLNPNPVAGYLNISLDLPGNPVEISVFDLMGRRVGMVSTDGSQSGENIITWAVPSGIPDGVYILRAMSGDAVSVSRFTLLRHR
jgi:hypothetical protein